MTGFAHKSAQGLAYEKIGESMHQWVIEVLEMTLFAAAMMAIFALLLPHWPSCRSKDTRLRRMKC